MLNTSLPSTLEATDERNINICHLYPILGSISFLVSSAFLVYEKLEGQEVKKEMIETITYSDQTDQQMYNTSALPKVESSKKASTYTCSFMTIVLLFFIIYVGVEASLNSLLPIFTVNSKLKMTQQEGSVITSVFWVTFAAIRFIYMFVPDRVTATQGVCFSLSMMSLGSLGLSIFAEYSSLYLSIFTAMVGVGCGPLFGNFAMWLEHHVGFDGKISAAIIIAGSIGGSVVPAVISQVISKMPMFLMYVEVGLSFILIILFAGSICVGNKLRKAKMLKTSEL